MKEKFSLKNTLGAAVLAASMAGCGVSATKSPEQSTGPLTTPAATDMLPIQTQAQLETPSATESELSTEQQAKNFVFDYWYGFLNKTQGVEDLPTDGYYLKTQIYNPDWQNNIDIIKNGGVADSDLQVSWVGGEVYSEPVGSNKYQGIKSQGGMTIKGINFSSEPNQLTNGEKSAGITWDGNVVLKYQVSWSENEFWPSDNNHSADLSTLKNWVTNWEQDPYWPASPWEDAQYVTSLVFQNGKWVMKSSDLTFDNPQLYDPLNKVVKPMPWMGDPSVCQNPNISSSCQLIKRTINY